MRFRLRTLLVVVTLGCLAIGFWVSWPRHTVRRFEHVLRTGELDRIQSLLVEGNIAGPPITMTIADEADFDIVPQPTTLREYATGRRRYTLKTPYGWSDFTVHRGRLSELHDRYFYGGVDMITVF